MPNYLSGSISIIGNFIYQQCIKYSWYNIDWLSNETIEKKFLRPIDQDSNNIFFKKHLNNKILLHAVITNNFDLTQRALTYTKNIKDLAEKPGVNYDLRIIHKHKVNGTNYHKYQDLYNSSDPATSRYTIEINGKSKSLLIQNHEKYLDQNIQDIALSQNIEIAYLLQEHIEQSNPILGREYSSENIAINYL
ncbi:MAG: hypothetical protein DGJ47_000822 [Rickettsiaceae bacterium]